MIARWAGVCVLVLADDQPAGAAAPSEAAVAHAKQVFASGEQAFEDGRYEDALSDFRRAYALSREPLSAEHETVSRRLAALARKRAQAAPALPPSQIQPGSGIVVMTLERSP